MRIKIVRDDATLASIAAGVVCEAVRQKPDAALGLPTGNTPILMYRELRWREKLRLASFISADGWALDEFADTTRGTPGTNHMFYREHVRVMLHGLRRLNPRSGNPNAHIRAFADALRRAGGLDLCVLGIGRNGHVAFNEPGSPVDAPARAVALTAVSREAHAATFGSLDRVPHRGMTLGMADILESRKILVLAHGAHKASVVAAAIEGPQTPDVPASWLQLHDDVTWIIDDAASSALSDRHHAS